MLKCGAEIYRVESTFKRICTAYGAADIEIFAIPSVIIGSVKSADGQKEIQFKRITATKNNLSRLEALNALSRKICAEKPPLDDFEFMLNNISSARFYPFLTTVICAAVVSGSFTLVFGGGVSETLISSIIGVIIFILDKNSVLNANPIPKIAILAFTGGVLSCIVGIVFSHIDIASVIIGTVVLLVPGLAFGNAVRNLLQGDLLSGTLGIVRSITTAVMIALGYIFSLGLFKIENTPAMRIEGLLFRAITTLIGVTALAIIFDVKPSHLTSVAIGGLITFLIYQGFIAKGCSVFISSFITSAIMCGYTEALARVEKAPATVFQVPCSIPILPGITLYNAMNSLISGRISEAGRYFFGSVQVGAGIACGITLVSVLIGIALEARKSIRKKIAKNY